MRETRILSFRVTIDFSLIIHFVVVVVVYKKTNTYSHGCFPINEIPKVRVFTSHIVCTLGVVLGFANPALQVAENLLMPHSQE